MKITTVLLGMMIMAALKISAQTSLVWHFKNGTNFSGIYVSSGTTKLVINNSGTNCILNLDDLTADDQARVTAIQEKKAAAEAEAREKYQQKLDTDREKYQSVSGIYSVDAYKNFIRYKKFDLRSDGTGIYLRDIGGYQRRIGQFQWSFTNGAVILNGSTYKLENDDLIDEQGNRWLHIR
jgi:hypothetical protein